MTNFENEFYNIHEGETCIVIGNGPSLSGVPVNFLKSRPSFGSNGIFLLKDFTPSYYVAVNPLVIEQFKDDINLLEAPKFIAQTKAFLIKGAYELYSIGNPVFSFNPAAYIYEGYTVTYVSMQLAYFMGFTTMLLVGVDHRYVYHGSPNSEQVMETHDPNHFNSQYFKGKRWNLPDLERSEKAYELARKAFEYDNRKIINLTANSALDTFEKGDIAEWI